jgi:hypothetical protein
VELHASWIDPAFRRHPDPERVIVPDPEFIERRIPAPGQVDFFVNRAIEFGSHTSAMYKVTFHNLCEQIENFSSIPGLRNKHLVIGAVEVSKHHGLGAKCIQETTSQSVPDEHIDERSSTTVMPKSSMNFR